MDQVISIVHEGYRYINYDWHDSIVREQTDQVQAIHPPGNVACSWHFHRYNSRSRKRRVARSSFVLSRVARSQLSSAARDSHVSIVAARDPAIPFFTTIVCKSAPIGRHRTGESFSIVCSLSASLLSRLRECVLSLAGATVCCSKAVRKQMSTEEANASSEWDENLKKFFKKVFHWSIIHMIGLKRSKRTRFRLENLLSSIFSIQVSRITKSLYDIYDFRNKFEMSYSQGNIIGEVCNNVSRSSLTHIQLSLNPVKTMSFLPSPPLPIPHSSRVWLRNVWLRKPVKHTLPHAYNNYIVLEFNKILIIYYTVRR